MIVNHFIGKNSFFASGIKFTSKKILKFAIILLGLSLNINTILHVGKMSLVVMIFTLATCFGGGYFIGKALGLNWKLSNLISAGTGICGGSAIAAIAPTIDADDSDVAYAMSATFLFDMAMIVLFPIMGRAIGMSAEAFGIWAGTAVNDTSSVVATGYAFSEAAGDFATMVKLTRTLSIIPTVLTFALIQMNFRRKEAIKNGENETFKLKILRDEEEKEVVSRNFIEQIIDKDLAEGVYDTVHTRFPPEPNGYLHIGHAKSILLNYGLAKQYGGKFNMRFDDTNPTKEKIEFVESIKADVEWLGADFEDRLFYASNYFQEMYEVAVKLIKKGKAYVSELTAEQMREYRGTLTEPGKNDPNRERSIEENLDLFERMRAGEFADGEKTLRAKIIMPASAKA